ncbi:MAG: hypothetical protein HRU19_05580 [Pseudobacteriovorax sp.]|nr:hypothetical protein [Pseudobacteriovorax sp.]
MLRNLILLGSCLLINPSVALSDTCDNRVKDVSNSPTDAGPYKVGARTVNVGNLGIEVWYPSDVEDVSNLSPKTYDLRNQLPDREGAKIPDAENPIQFCDCYQDLPIAVGQESFPVVVFVHGTAAFRTQALPQMTHWASRGFIVLSADHPRIRLKDLLGRGGLIGAILANQKRDVRNMIAALNRGDRAFDFLEGRYDLTRIGLSGHSAGGNAIGDLGDIPGVKVLIPMTANRITPNPQIESVLVMGAARDGVVPYSSQESGYEGYPGQKTLVTINNAGHLAYSEICSLGAENGGILAIAIKNGVRVPSIVERLGYDGCAPDFLPPQETWEIINYATTAVLEDVLYCSETSAPALKALPSVFGDEVTFKSNQL